MGQGDKKTCTGYIRLEVVPDYQSTCKLTEKKQSTYEVKYTTSKSPEVIVEQITATPYNSPSVKLQLNIDAHATYIGQVTGKQYEWARAGSIAVVDSLDAAYLLEKRIKSQSCCNGSDVAVFLEIN